MKPCKSPRFAMATCDFGKRLQIALAKQPVPGITAEKM
jgi:hypothetical protein